MSAIILLCTQAQKDRHHALPHVYSLALIDSAECTICIPGKARRLKRHHWLDDFLLKRRQQNVGNLKAGEGGIQAEILNREVGRMRETGRQGKFTKKE